MLNFDQLNRTLLETLYRAAQNGTLDKVPKELFTAESVLDSNGCGTTVLHHAAYFGQLDQVPQALLTEALLLTRRDSGTSVLVIAAARGHLDQLLGIELSDKSRGPVGDIWYEKNLKYCEELRKSKESLVAEDLDNSHEVELF